MVSKLYIGKLYPPQVEIQKDRHPIGVHHLQLLRNSKVVVAGEEEVEGVVEELV